MNDFFIDFLLILNGLFKFEIVRKFGREFLLFFFEVMRFMEKFFFFIRLEFSCFFLDFYMSLKRNLLDDLIIFELV